MKEDIKQLKLLQGLDREITALEKELTELDKSLEKRGAAVEAYREKGEAMRERMAELEESRKALEAGLEEDVSRISDRQGKMMNIQSNREYQSLLKEAEDAKKTSKEKEEELIRVAGELEELEQSIKENDNLLKGEEQLLAEDCQAAEGKKAELDAKIEKIGKKIKNKSKQVSAAVLKKYEAIKSRRNGVGLAEVTDGVCRACFMNIPPQLYNDLLKEQNLLLCPTCNRIMYPGKAAS